MPRLLCVLLFCVFQQIDGDNAAASCGNFMQDWCPSVKPQSSAAPYALNVSDEDGNFNQRSWRSPTYGSETVQTGSYHTMLLLCAGVVSFEVGDSFVDKIYAISYSLAIFIVRKQSWSMSDVVDV